jgi:hypothetical protein
MHFRLFFATRKSMRLRKEILPKRIFLCSLEETEKPTAKPAASSIVFQIMCGKLTALFKVFKSQNVTYHTQLCRIQSFIEMEIIYATTCLAHAFLGQPFLCYLSYKISRKILILFVCLFGCKRKDTGPNSISRLDAFATFTPSPMT